MFLEWKNYWKHCLSIRNNFSNTFVSNKESLWTGNYSCRSVQKSNVSMSGKYVSSSVDLGLDFLQYHLIRSVSKVDYDSLFESHFVYFSSISFLWSISLIVLVLQRIHIWFFFSWSKDQNQCQLTLDCLMKRNYYSIVYTVKPHFFVRWELNFSEYPHKVRVQIYPMKS